MKKIIPSLFFLFAFLVSAGCGKSPDKLYSEAKALIANQETVDRGLESLIAFDKNYPRDPREPEILLCIASAYQAKQDYIRAVETYESLSQRYPGTPEEYKGRFLLGYLYYDEMHDMEKAAATFKDFVAAYPDSELTMSARLLLENMDRPIDQWPVVQQLNASEPREQAATKSDKGK